MKWWLVVSLVFVLCLAVPIDAHEFLMKPSVQKVEKGKPIGIDVLETHVFIAPEETPVFEDVEVLVFQGKDFTSPIVLEEISKERVLRGTFVAETDEDIVFLGKRKPQYWSMTTEGILAGDRLALEAQGKKVISVGEYEKYAYVFIPGSKPSIESTYNTDLKEQPPLIITPSFNPNTVKVGQKLNFKILLRGKVLAKAPVVATYDGFSREEGVFFATMESDDKGEFAFTPNKPGLWVVHTESTEKLTNGSVDEQNIRSAILFWVGQ